MNRMNESNQSNRSHLGVREIEEIDFTLRARITLSIGFIAEAVVEATCRWGRQQ